MDSDSHQQRDPRLPEPHLHAAEAVQFVRESIDLATRDPELACGGAVDASGVCRVLLELSVDRYGRGGKDVLMDWGIVTSEDVGLIIDRLIKAGAAQQYSDGPADDFVGIFDLTKPPESWQLRW